MEVKDNQQMEPLIQELENKIGGKIPANMIEYISANGSKKIDKAFTRVVDEHFSQEMQLWEVLSLQRVNKGWDSLYPDADMTNLKLLPFGESLGSPIICMSLAEEHYGSIYVFDYDFGPTKVAASLEEFLSRLTD